MNGGAVFGGVGTSGGYAFEGGDFEGWFGLSPPFSKSILRTTAIGGLVISGNKGYQSGETF